MAAKQGGAAAQRARQLLEQGLVAEEYAEGLEAARWPGRGQVRPGSLFECWVWVWVSLGGRRGKGAKELEAARWAGRGQVRLAPLPEC